MLTMPNILVWWKKLLGLQSNIPRKPVLFRTWIFGHGTISGWLLINVSTIIFAANFFGGHVWTYPVGGKSSCRDQVSKCHYPPNPVKLFTVSSMKALPEHLPWISQHSQVPGYCNTFHSQSAFHLNGIIGNLWLGRHSGAPSYNSGEDIIE